MHVTYHLPKKFYQLVKHKPKELSPEGKGRQQTMIAWEALREANWKVERACQMLEMPRATLYRWRKRWKEKGAWGLEERSRRPKRLRCVSWSKELTEAVRELREQYPRWGKDKLCVLLGREGFHTSASTVGRILAYLKQRGLIHDPPRMIKTSINKGKRRPFALRKPKNYAIQLPGDLVQIDTLDVSLVPGKHFKHFTARDVVSRWDVLQACQRATANHAKQFLETVQQRMPFPVRAVQVDGGSEFRAEFEIACQEMGIRLFVLPPHSPKLNGCVERAHRTHTEEFYEVVDSDFTVADLREKLLQWEVIYNTVRPHQALGYLTPQQFLQCYRERQRKEVMCH